MHRLFMRTLLLASVGVTLACREGIDREWPEEAEIREGPGAEQQGTGGAGVQNPSRGRYDEIPGPEGSGWGGNPRGETAPGLPEEDLESRPLGGMDTEIGQEAGEQGPDRGISGGPGYLEGPAGAEPKQQPPEQ